MANNQVSTRALSKLAYSWFYVTTQGASKETKNAIIEKLSAREAQRAQDLDTLITNPDFALSSGLESVEGSSSDVIQPNRKRNASGDSPGGQDIVPSDGQHGLLAKINVEFADSTNFVRSMHTLS